jgi:hypothetical protein
MFTAEPVGQDDEVNLIANFSEEGVQSGESDKTFQMA